MATILLSAAGAAIGSGIGGTVLGLSGAVIGRAVGATLGRSIDQRVLGSGSDVSSVGKVDRFHVSGVGYGTAQKAIWGRVRVAGEIVWASRFLETRRVSGGGKGTPRPSTESFSYSVSLAIALCRGEAQTVGRIWADGVEISINSLNFRFYSGSEDQLPDPKIEAVEGADFAPAYRGTCYVVIENLALSRFGNRVPQFSFEVVKRAQPGPGAASTDLAESISAVALIPGSGEYALATTPVYFNNGPGRNVSANVNTIQGITDFSVSLRQLDEELPNCGSVSLVVSWFGSDLRCGFCEIQPKVDRHGADGVGMPWIVSGTPRNFATLVPQSEGRAVYGGTPTDQSIIEAIQALRLSGKEVMFYPFILMDQLDGNGLPDPWNPAADQPKLPWRGRITLEHAPGTMGTTDQTVNAEAELASFLGSALPSDFSTSLGTVNYHGTPEWSYRRFILHYAHLCAMAGGVDSFCVGSELRGLTQIRSVGNSFPMVAALRDLAAEVKGILGSGTKVSYAADWSEYFGYHVNGDTYFHLDSFWSDSNVDFVGIDNYMPISDWREGSENADADWGSIYDLDYLISNIRGGEGFDWFYDSPEGVVTQRRIPIVDTAYGEDWVFRNKDILGWWSNEHRDRVNGARLTNPTGWNPGMKPIIFTEYGCGAIDKATNQPNRFVDPKSSESLLPTDSSGRRDDFIQMRYFEAMKSFWEDSSNNPVSATYGQPMVDFSRSHAWAWDARPFPDFPGNSQVWSDSGNYIFGHWLNGRSSNQPLAAIISEICSESGLDQHVNLTEVYGVVRGFAIESIESARTKLQPMMLALGVEVRDNEGAVEFIMRSSARTEMVDSGFQARADSQASDALYTRDSATDQADRVKLIYLEAENDYQVRALETVSLGKGQNATAIELNMVLTESEAGAITDRWLAEAQIAGQSIRIHLPKSRIGLVAGDLIDVDGDSYRVERIEESETLKIEGSKVDLRAYQSGAERGIAPFRPANIAPTPVFPLFLDLPLLNGGEVPHAPHIAVTATPWPGTVGVWSSPSDSGFLLNSQVQSPSIIGETETTLEAFPFALWDRGSILRVRLSTGSLSSTSEADVLNGANVLAIGDGSPENWEVLQFSQAVMVDTDTFELSVFLRGLVGSDAIAPSVWPAGSLIVVLDGLIPQIDLSLAARGLTRSYRIGSLENGYADPSAVALSSAFNGIGLRPYSVAHLKAERLEGGDIAVRWIRRTRIDGDNWQSVDVPLGEESESYTVKVTSGSTTLRQVVVTTQTWTYTQALQTLDGVSGEIGLSVAQNSITFGEGPFRTIQVG